MAVSILKAQMYQQAINVLNSSNVSNYGQPSCSVYYMLSVLSFVNQISINQSNINKYVIRLFSPTFCQQR